MGAVALLGIVLILPSHPPTTKSKDSQLRVWLNLDWIGTFLSVAVVIMFMLPLQWAGSQKPWTDPAVISMLVLVCHLPAGCTPSGSDLRSLQSVIPVIIFVLWERRCGDQAVLPLSFFHRRNICGAFLEAVS